MNRKPKINEVAAVVDDAGYVRSFHTSFSSAMEAMEKWMKKGERYMTVRETRKLEPWQYQ